MTASTDVLDVDLLNAVAEAASKASRRGWLPLTERYRIASAVLEVIAARTPGSPAQTQADADRRLREQVRERYLSRPASVDLLVEMEGEVLRNEYASRVGTPTARSTAALTVVVLRELILECKARLP